MKVSILIPMYNAENYISDTIKSALNQTWQNIEIIVVDDGSTDKSYEIAKTFEYDDRVFIYKQINSGGCVARNLAFSKSTGDYIQYLDADDLLAVDKIELQMSKLKEFGYNNRTLCLGNYFTFNGNIVENKFSCTMSKLLQSYKPATDALIEIWNKNFNSFPYSSYLVPREIILRTRDWNTSLHRSQDSEFMARVISQSSEIIYVKKSLFYYRNTLNSLSRRTLTYKQIYSEFLVNITITDILINTYGNDKRILQLCGKRFAQFVYNYYPQNKKILDSLYNYIDQKSIKLNWDERGNVFKILNTLFGWKVAKYIITAKNNLKFKNK